MHNAPSEAAILRSLLEDQEKKIEALTQAIRIMVDDLECEHPMMKHALHTGRKALGRE